MIADLVMSRWAIPPDLDRPESGKQSECWRTVANVASHFWEPACDHGPGLSMRFSTIKPSYLRPLVQVFSPRTGRDGNYLLVLWTRPQHAGKAGTRFQVVPSARRNTCLRSIWERVLRSVDYCAA